MYIGSPSDMVVSNPNSHAGSQTIFVRRPESSSHRQRAGCTLPPAISNCWKRNARRPQKPTTIADSNTYAIIPYRKMLHQDNSSSRVSEIGGSLVSASVPEELRPLDQHWTNTGKGRSCNQVDIAPGRSEFVAPAQAGWCSRGLVAIGRVSSAMTLGHGLAQSCPGSRQAGFSGGNRNTHMIGDLLGGMPLHLPLLDHHPGG